MISMAEKMLTVASSRSRPPPGHPKEKKNESKFKSTTVKKRLVLHLR